MTSHQNVMILKKLLEFVLFTGIAAFILGCAPALVTAPSSVPEANTANANEVIVWVNTANRGELLAEVPYLAAERMSDSELQARLVPLQVDVAIFRNEVETALSAGRGPDITTASQRDLRDWAEAGLIIPLDNCLTKHPEFADVNELSWEALKQRGQTWGIPYSVVMDILYFNKPKLRELGWSEGEIEGLPERIRQGEFTLPDLFTATNQAIEQGVVDKGFGYWMHMSRRGDLLLHYLAFGGEMYDAGQDKLVVNQEALAQAFTFQRRLTTEEFGQPDFLVPVQYGWANRLVWGDAVSHGKVLFWTASNDRWSEWATENAAEVGGETYLRQNVGYALHPSAVSGRSGHTLYSVDSFVIASEAASGRRKQAEACALLAKTLTPKINTPHNVVTSRQGVLKRQAGDPGSNRFFAATRYMLDYAHRVPGQHPGWSVYNNTLQIFMAKATSEELSPVKAAEQAVSDLQAQLGEALIVK